MQTMIASRTQAVVLTSTPVCPVCVSSSLKREGTAEGVKYEVKAACDPLTLSLASPIQSTSRIRGRRVVKGGKDQASRT